MENYQGLGMLGEGTYGMVIKARHRQTGQIVAIKRFKESDEDEQVRKTALREVRLLKQLKHDNIVNLIEVFRHNRKLFLVFEYVERTILDDLEKNPDGLDPTDVKKAMYQLIQSIRFCHSHNVIHRDIKPENLLMSKNGVLKLCDFGFARPLATNGDRYTDYVSTRWYRCPELLIGDEYGKPVDIWAIGCMFAEMSNGLPLFGGESDVDQLFQIMKRLGNLTPRMRAVLERNPLFVGVQIPEVDDIQPLEAKLIHVDGTGIDFLRRCLEYEPGGRWTCDELLQHPYFDGFAEWFEPELAAAVRADASEFVMKKKRGRKDRGGEQVFDEAEGGKEIEAVEGQDDAPAPTELPGMGTTADRDREREAREREREREAKEREREREAKERERERERERDRDREREREREREAKMRDARDDRDTRPRDRHSLETMSVGFADSIVGHGVNIDAQKKRDKLQSREGQRAERQSVRLPSRDSHRDGRGREDARDKLASRDRKRDTMQEEDYEDDDSHLPTLTSEASKAPRLVAFPNLTADAEAEDEPSPRVRGAKTSRKDKDTTPSLSIPKLAGVKAETKQSSLLALPNVRDKLVLDDKSIGIATGNFAYKTKSKPLTVGTNAVPLKPHAFSQAVGYKSQSTSNATAARPPSPSGVSGSSVAGGNSTSNGGGRTPVHKPLPQFQYGALPKPPSSRTGNSSGTLDALRGTGPRRK